MSEDFLATDPNPTPRLSALTEYERSFAREYPHFVRFFEHIVNHIWMYIREKNNKMLSFHTINSAEISEINELLAEINSEPIPLQSRKAYAMQIAAATTAPQRPCEELMSNFTIIESYINIKYPTFYRYFTLIIGIGDDEITWYEFRHGMLKFSVPISVIAEVDRILWEREREPIMKVLGHLPLPIAWAVRDELSIDDGNYRELPYFCEP